MLDCHRMLLKSRDNIMRTRFFAFVLSLLTIVFSTSALTAEEAKVEIFSEETSLSELAADGLISDVGYNDLLVQGLTSDTPILVKVTRDLHLLSKQVKENINVGLLSSLAQPGDEREHRWQREEEGSIYEYVRTERYFDSSGWREVFFSRTYIGPAPKDGDVPPGEIE